MSARPTLSQIRAAVASGDKLWPGPYRTSGPAYYGAPFRRSHYTIPSDLSTVSDGGTLRFVFPCRGYVDFSQLHLQCDVSAITGPKGTSGNYAGAYFDFGFWNLIDHIRVVCGSQQLALYESYGLVQNVNHALSGDCVPWVSDGGHMQQWLGLPYNTLSRGDRFKCNNTARNILIPLNVPCLTGKVIPLKFLSDSIMIEIVFKNATGCTAVKSNDSNNVVVPSFTLQNAKLNTELIQVTTTYDSMVERQMSTPSGISWWYNDWDVSVKSVQSTTETVQITAKLGNINSVVALHAPYFYNADPVTFGRNPPNQYADGNDHGDQNWCWPDLNLLKYGFKWDNESDPGEMIRVYDPTLPIITNSGPFSGDQYSDTDAGQWNPQYHSDYFFHVMKAQQKLSSKSVFGNGNPYLPYWGQTISPIPNDLQPFNASNANSFLIIHNFESFPGAALMDGLDTTRAENIFQLILNYKQALPRPIPLVLLVSYTGMISFSKTSITTIK